RKAEIQSTFKTDWKFLKQLLRWTRNTWRSDIRSLFVERYIWRQHPYTAFTMFDKLFNPLYLYTGFSLLIVNIVYLKYWYYLLAIYLGLVLMSRFIRLGYHWYRNGLWDIWMLPIFIFYAASFLLIKVYCLFTLHKTGWGSRKLT